MDWAVLCSINRVSSIMIFWNGGTDDCDSLSESPDVNCLKEDGPGKAMYSRYISTADASDMAACARDARECLPTLDHQGIEDGFAGKASSVLYLHDGQWLELPGSD